jgi:hypothetical protein
MQRRTIAMTFFLNSICRSFSRIAGKMARNKSVSVFHAIDVSVISQMGMQTAEKVQVIDSPLVRDTICLDCLVPQRHDLGATAAVEQNVCAAVD